MSRATTPPPADEAADRPPAQQDVEDTIERALNSGTGRLVMAELTELNGLFRGYIAYLYPAAEAAVDRLWHGSLAWYNGRSRLDRLRDLLEQQLDERPLSAHIQVTTLAHECRWLLAQGREQG
ncbi:DUF6415 family natural product biosynthesis protein [Streptomyces sp. NPDC002055]|uniref:DUF6415 family natural product biosynthesis protein n=1 Tax=Streptomyces sp. NPDC002055 TaxID=3154534 RepID=UPI00331BCD5E